ncbi:protein EFFECTOR OF TRANSCRIPTION 2-like [Impatiens glandulifera]|uniref:protein EFFECTOR OF TRANSCRIPTION 2-like n=1 Tax=Impatiens glandulifera TaxID=253017 RepID=UPI001FB0F22B|nr:protein EFFECTOR OF TRANSCRIPTION 2-like [Impatiens glandulifera]
MAAAGKERIAVLPATRLKREDCKRTKHDSVFSDWKVLIGPSDWDDHSVGKEGAERYRVHNLPNSASCPGVYELGIAIPNTKAGRETPSKKNKQQEDTIVVYLGQADNVRTRLQNYGREGSHLEKGNSVIDPAKEKLGLFKEVFARGYAILYRWAPMKSKRDAEKTESQMLENFDYAWNKEKNVMRRPSDIFQKLHQGSSTTSGFIRFPFFFKPKKVGIKIEACKPFENTNNEKNDLFSRILRMGRSLPVTNEIDTVICGVALGEGTICKQKPVEGRKRCLEHKGMKINGSTSKMIKDEEEIGIETSPEKANNNEPPTSESICGLNLENGNFCMMPSVKGRKRCNQHKGMRAQAQKSNIDSNTCSAAMKNGSVCSRVPVHGRKRCEQHKGMKAAAYCK